MKTLYFDCSMGAAGDMLTAALCRLLPDLPSFIDKLNAIGIPHVHYEVEKSVKCGISGLHMRVTVDGREEHEHNHGEHEHNHDEHEHRHSGLHDIEHIVGHMNVPECVKDDIMAVYKLIADAESAVHGVPVTDIHFHEVGTLDAVADVTAVCMLMHEIAPDDVICSPIHVGAGQVKCAHGILPVPAPATAHILHGIPIYGGSIKSELCTPTGAALLKYFVKKFGDMPVMSIDKIGYGMGMKDFIAANCVRVFLGQSEDKKDCVYELSCNIDDMTAEDIAYAAEVLLSEGARDVFTTPVVMKKSRPAVLLSVLCAPDDRESMARLIFMHTSTIGIRETKHDRYVLDRQTETVDTKYGTVRVKRSAGFGVSRSKAEYEDLARIARDNNMNIEQVRRLLGDL